MTQQNLLRQRLCLLSVLVLCFWVGWSLFAQLSAGVGAYPAPDNPIAFFPDSYPPPTSLHVTPPPAQAPQTFIPSQFAYFPMLTKGYHILFSMTGLVNNQPVGTIVPYGLRTEPYNWGIHTGANVTTPIQAIRSCLHFSPKYYQNQQYTFERWFDPGVVGVICFDPFSQKLAQIVYSLNGLSCPDYTNDGNPEPCLSTQLDPNTPTAETIFQGYVQSHPEWVWLVGNETDGAWQDALINQITYTDGSTVPIGGTDQPTITGPQMCAIFFAYVYELGVAALAGGEEDSAPQLVFCQASFANYPEDPATVNGLRYCEQAYNFLQIMGYSSNIIYVLAVHNYIKQCEELILGMLTCRGDLLTETNLPLTMGKWIERLEEFEAWTETPGLGLADKPLWLTEFGMLDAWCVSSSALRPGDQVGGVPCPTEPIPYPTKTHLFYGRNDQEGVWGMQRTIVYYFYNRGADNRWTTVWWFNAHGGDGNGDGVCDQGVWLWGNDFGNCPVLPPLPTSWNVSRGGADLPPKFGLHF